MARQPNVGSRALEELQVSDAGQLWLPPPRLAENGPNRLLQKLTGMREIDIWVNPTEINYQRLLKAFAHFGLPLDAIELNDFLATDKTDVFTFGRPPVAIDILTKVKGLEFETAYASSEAILVDGAPTQLLSAHSLRTAKIAAGRHKDLDDLEHLS